MRALQVPDKSGPMQMKPEPQQAVPELVSAQSLQRGKAVHFYSAPPLPPMGLPPLLTNPPPTLPLAPPTSNLFFTNFLHFHFLESKQPFLSSAYLSWVEECHLAIEMGPKDAFGCNLIRWSTHEVN